MVIGIMPLHKVDLDKNIHCPAVNSISWFSCSRDYDGDFQHSIRVRHGQTWQGVSCTMAMARCFQPTTSPGFITCPVLVSAVANNISDEVRRQIQHESILELLDLTKKVPVAGHGWCY